MPALTDRTTLELTLLAQLGFPPSAIHTDGTLPHFFWVAPGGTDGVGNGSLSKPFQTHLRAARQTVDGRGDIILMSPGSYASTLDIGSGGTGSGENGGYAKRNLKIIGTGGAHTGITQIIGDGSTAQPTIRVLSGYGRGFVLANVELDTNGLAQPCFEYVTNDTAALTATSSDEHGLLKNVDIVSDNTPTTGLLFTGATKVKVVGGTIAGCVVGVAWRGSLSNWPDNLKFYDLEFHDNTTADVASYSGGEVIGACEATNIQFFRPHFLDRGGTPVTNYANIVGTTVNCGFYEFVSARDVADATLMQLPANWVAIGRSAAEAEFIIGA